MKLLLCSTLMYLLNARRAVAVFGFSRSLTIDAVGRNRSFLINC